MNRADYLGVTGAALKGLRRISRFSQQQLADEVGLVRKTLWNFENGRTGIGLFDFVSICKALDQNPEEIMRRIAERYKTKQNNSSQK